MTTRIAIIVGSTRPGRLGSAVGEWVHEHAVGRGASSTDGGSEGSSGGSREVEYTLVELADQKLQLLDSPTVPGAADRQYDDPATTRWGELVDSFDGFVWVTPEYNHSVPAAFKNALDVLYPEWGNKAVGFVGYGADGAVRAVEHWRTIAANVRMVDVRAQVALSTFTDFDGSDFTPDERRAGELAKVLDQLEEMAGVLKPLRG